MTDKKTGKSLTEEEVKTIVDERRNEIGELHPTVQNMLNLFVASGSGVANALSMAIKKPKKFAEIVGDDGKREGLEKLLGFFRSTIVCAKPLVDFKTAKMVMMSIMMAAELDIAREEFKKSIEKKTDKNGESK